MSILYCIELGHCCWATKYIIINKYITGDLPRDSPNNLVIYSSGNESCSCYLTKSIKFKGCTNITQSIKTNVND